MRDLIAGDSYGYTTLFLETGSGLHNAGHIQRDSSGVQVDIRVSANSYPCIQDWNEDGKKDLIIGEIENVLPDTGNIRIYLNSGTNADPRFRDYQLMKAGNGHLLVVHAHPEIIDLDGDSFKDLVCGNENGYIYFFKNRGTNQTPYFNPEYETLMTVDSVFIDGYTNSRIDLCDWTGDSDLDIILGGQDGYVWLCENATNTGTREHSSGGELVHSFRLMNNPVKHSAWFSLMLSKQTTAWLKIYALSGEYIDEVSLPCNDPGFFMIEWRPRNDLCSGIYFAVLQTAHAHYTQKLLVIR